MSLPSSSTAMPERKAVPQLDTLTSVRGIAAWWVVLFHFEDYLKPYVYDFIYRFIEMGYLAVDLFFCLSGFVIFLNYGSLSTKDFSACVAFFTKRLAKIYPLHLATLGLYLALIGAVLALHHRVPLDKFSTWSFVLNLLLIQDWNTLNYLSWNVPAWSISAEFAAYLLFPFIALLTRQASKSLKYCAMAVLASLIILNLFFAPEAFNLGSAITELGVIRCVCQFTIGAILAAIFTRGFVSKGQIPIFLGVAIIFFVSGLYFYQSLLIPACWASLVLGLALHDPNSKLLRTRLLVAIGEVSYATYMVHYLAKDAFKLALVHVNIQTPASYIVATFLVIGATSVVLYRLIEKPAQRWLVRSALT